MSEVWTKWQGQVINGTFPLQRYLGNSGHSGVFITEVRGREPAECAIKLLPIQSAVADSQLALWKAAAALDHPHLLRIVDTGGCLLEGQRYLFVVMEYADQTLAQLLERRAMSEDEAREMLPPVLRALGFLNNRNLVQGQLKPANILVVGEQIKLATDTIRRVSEAAVRVNMVSVYDPPEVHDGGGSTAGDIWALGITLFEALTRKSPLSFDARREGLALPASFSPLFRDLVAMCLSRRPFDRPKVAELEARVRGTATGRFARPNVVAPAATPAAARAKPAAQKAAAASPAADARPRPNTPVSPLAPRPMGQGPQQPSVKRADPVPQPAARPAGAQAARPAAPQQVARKPAPQQQQAAAAAAAEWLTYDSPPDEPEIASIRPIVILPPAAMFATRAPAPPPPAAAADSESALSAIEKAGGRLSIPLLIAAIAILALGWAGIRVLSSHAREPAPPAAREPAGAMLETQTEEPRPAALEAPAVPTPVDAAASSAASSDALSSASATGEITRPPQVASSESSSSVAAAEPAAVETPNILHEEMPNVPARVRRTIRGHVRVSVRVILDPDGSVFAALVDARGPSRYFAKLAIEAAKKWSFPPPESPAARLRQIKFDFSRDGTIAQAGTVD